MGDDHHALCQLDATDMAFLHADVEWFGDGPSGFHLTNLMLHLGSTLLVTQIAYRLTVRRLLRTLTALLFACHPIPSSSGDLDR